MTTKGRDTLKPIIKWMGGKSKLITHYKKYGWLPDTRIIEPFCGSAAVSLDSELPFAINDANSYLINFYQVVSNLSDDDIKGFIADFFKHQFTKEEYYDYRNKQYELITPYELAQWFFYINRVGFNGLWRVNAHGKVNVAFGNPIESWSAFKNITFDNFKTFKDKLKGKEISSIDGEEFLLQTASTGDWVFVDPPYDNTEDKYTEGGWSRTKLESLKKAMLAIRDRGCVVYHANSNTEFVRELFQEHEISEIGRMGGMNSDPTKRKTVKELLIKI